MRIKREETKHPLVHISISNLICHLFVVIKGLGQPQCAYIGQVPEGCDLFVSLKSNRGVVHDVFTAFIESKNEKIRDKTLPRSHKYFKLGLGQPPCVFID